MTPIKMTENSSSIQAAIASIFNQPLEVVENFNEGLNLHDNSHMILYNIRIQSWLEKRGEGLLLLCVGPDDLIEYQQICKEICNYHLISAWDKFDLFHTVVGKHGKVDFDPYPYNWGLSEPTNDNPWYFGIITERL